MAYKYKNGQLLKNIAHLEICVNVKKMGQSYKNGLELQKRWESENVSQ